MTRLLLIGVLVLVVSSQSKHCKAELPDLGEPAQSNAALYAVALTAHATDWKQTRYIGANCDEWHEQNPVLGRCPGAAATNLWFLGTAAVLTGVASQLSYENERRLLLVWSALEVTVVAKNARMGIKMRW